MDRTFSDLFPNTMKGLNKDLGGLREFASEQKDRASEWARKDLIPTGKKLSRSLGSRFAMQTSESFITRRPIASIAIAVGVCSLAAMLLKRAQKTEDQDFH